MWRLVKFFLALLILFVGTLIFIRSLDYYLPDFTSGYLHSKKIFYDGIFKYALYAHIAASPIILLCGTLQFFTNINQKYVKLHRSLGFVYIALVILISAPGGLILAVYASGGFYTKLSFALLSIIWFYFTLLGLAKIRQRDFASHNHYMLRSYALTLSAIILRILSFVFIHYFSWSGPTMYLTISWLSWVPILIIIEVCIIIKKRKAKVIISY